jgi:hypothetical protein
MSRIGTRAALLVASLAAIAGCGEKPAPFYPDFTADVAPLLGARCIRCHGAGGTLNGDSDVTDPTIQGFMGKPNQGYFDCDADRGDCSSATSTTCKRGFLYYANGMPGQPLAGLWLKVMPPAPAPQLTDRESGILHAWLAHPTPGSKPCSP